MKENSPICASATAIDDRLRTAHGRRRSRKLSRADVLCIFADVRAPATREVAWREETGGPFDARGRFRFGHAGMDGSGESTRNGCPDPS